EVLDVGGEGVAVGGGAAGGAAAGELDDGVGDGVDGEAVVSGAAGELVRPRAAVQHVIARAAVDLVGAAVADDGVGEAVAGAVDRGASGQGQVLDLGCERVGNRGLDEVRAVARDLGDRVGGVVHGIGVVAAAADHRVRAGAAVDKVCGGVAGDGVGERVAGAVDRGDAGQDQVLDVGAEGVGNRGLDGVRAFARGLGDRVGGVVHDIGVVAGAAGHRIRAEASVERVVACTAA